MQDDTANKATCATKDIKEVESPVASIYEHKSAELVNKADRSSEQKENDRDAILLTSSAAETIFDEYMRPSGQSPTQMADEPVDFAVATTSMDSQNPQETAEPQNDDVRNHKIFILSRTL